MTETFLATLKGMLFSPTSTLQSLRDEPLSGALKYYAILLLISTLVITLLTAVMSVETQNILDLAAIAEESLFTFIILFISFLIEGLTYHIFGVYIAGGREGMGQTVKALAYASTPWLLLIWIPVINIIGGFWTFILFMRGIRKLQNLSSARALLAIVLSVVITVGILILSEIIAALVFGTAGSI